MKFLKSTQTLLALSLVLGLLTTACDLSAIQPGSSTPTPGGVVPKPSNAREITMAYSSEKKPFIEPLAAQFNAAKHTLPGDTRPIYVTTSIVDSGVAQSGIA